jgi:hypothetical protein
VSYNGFKSWNAWNVSLWLNNDEPLYRMMLSYIHRNGSKDRAAAEMARDMKGQKTKDGASYNRSSIRAAMIDL